MALLDINMEGVQAAGEYQELPVGEYIIRIEDTEKKPTKDKFYEDGRPHEDNGKNFYLNISSQVEGGPNHGKIDFERLNLWNSNQIAVNIAKSTLKAIQDAIGYYGNDSTKMHGKYLLLKVKLNSRGVPTKHYEKLPEHMYSLLPGANNPAPIALNANTTVTASLAQQQAQPQVAQVAAQAAQSSALPAWAVKK